MKLDFSRLQERYIGELMLTGLHGETPSEVVKSLVLQGLRQAASDGLICLSINEERK